MCGAFEDVGVSEMTLALAGITEQLMGFRESKASQNETLQRARREGR